MDRRSLLATLGFALFAGCGQRSGSDDTPVSSTTETVTSSETPTVTATGTVTDAGQDALVVGDPLRNDGVETTVERVVLANELATNENELVPDEGERFLLVEVRSRNVGDQQTRLPTRRDFAVIVDNSQFETIDWTSFNSPTRATAPESGPLYEGDRNAFPGVETSGWLVFEVPANVSEPTIAVSTGQYKDAAIAYWQATVDSQALPNISVTSVELPATAERYTSTTATLTLENTGDAAGQFQTTVGRDVYSEPISVSVRVPGGETIQHSVELLYPPLSLDTRQEATFHFGERSVTVEYERPVRQVGEGFQTASGTEIAVRDLVVGDDLVLYSSWDGGYTEVDRRDTQRWVFVQLEIRNIVNASEFNPPGYGSFAIVDSGSEVGSLEYPHMGGGGREFRGSVTGDPYEAQSARGGESFIGWLVFRVGINANYDEIGVRWDAGMPYDGEFSPVVRWEQ